MIDTQEMLKVTFRLLADFTPEEGNKTEICGFSRDEVPLYLMMSELARCVVTLLEDDRIPELQEVAATLERWIVDGDEDVRKAAIVGLIEDVQNANLHRTTSPEQFAHFLYPTSLTWWDKVNKFLAEGQLLD